MRTSYPGSRGVGMNGMGVWIDHRYDLDPEREYEPEDPTLDFVWDESCPN